MTHLIGSTRSPRVNRRLLHSALAAVVGGLLFPVGAQASIIGINTPSTSNASITFDDTASSLPPSGATNTGPSVSPWNGSTVALALTTDPTTLDFASGSIVGSFTPASNIYSLNFNNIVLSQSVGNTGFATLDFAFNIEFQLDSLGLPLQPTLFPNFFVNGTVQSIAGAFAAMSGYINYSGVTTAGTIGVLETVNYSGLWLTPGPFSATVFGVPVSGTTPALVGGTTLTLDGQMKFIVDPAEIHASTVPEPGTMGLLGLGGAVVAVRAACRRRREKRSVTA